MNALPSTVCRLAGAASRIGTRLFASMLCTSRVFHSGGFRGPLSLSRAGVFSSSAWFPIVASWYVCVPTGRTYGCCPPH